MADESPSIQNLIEELGFPPSEHQFLLRLFGSSDPFAGLPGTDLEPSHSRNQPGQLSSTSIAHRLASTRLWQAIPPLSGERANQFRLPPTHRPPSGFREGLEGRDLVQYGEEWTSLIAADSESLFSELLQQVVSDEHPCLESSELPEHHKTSEKVARPESVGLPSPSVYDSEIGEPPDSVFNLNDTLGTQGNFKKSQDPRTLKEPGSFEQLLQSFPVPPGRNQTVGDQSFSHVSSDSQRVLPKDSAQANTSTVSSTQIESVASLPRISRFSEELDNNNSIREQDSSNVCAKASTSALDTSGLGNTSTSSSGIPPSSTIDTSTVVNTRNVSFRVPSLSPRASFRELHPPIDHHQGQQAKLDSSHQAHDRANKYTAFPEYHPQVRPISYVIRRQRPFKPIFEGRPTPTASPRYYQKTPLRISSRPSTTSFASGKRSVRKCKRVLKHLVKRLKHLFCQARKSPGTPSTLNR
ncbi:hypothetical protein N7517_001923 [Penicillium concentricum]|uniref:Uncharacterized protein n=1 Tax=Penicillium concentricum TaxID=293559 RepID=A0A9W9VJB1_9EURO|nr:uncharacterized protein N7517_001923 [Penicillium concentricum]KAJ5384012.1 hypothetical protein N7517_001923 [Penicillium concentricum]